MYTQCPECGTVYQVSPKDLSVAHGEVRCGECDTTFNALVFLSETLPARPGRTAGERVAAQESDAGHGARMEKPGEESESPAESSRDTGTGEPDLEFHMDRARGSDERETADHVASAEAAIRAPASELGETDWGIPPRPAATEPSDQEDELDEDDLLALFEAKPRNRAKLVWVLVCCSMLLALLAQAAHHWRSQLVEYPVAGSYLFAIYDALGMPIDRSVDLGAYRFVRRPEVLAEPDATTGSATLRVIARVANEGRRAQPFPLIKLSLQDRWGTPLAMRDFGPQEYAAAEPRPGLLSPGDSFIVDLHVVDPGTETVGFALDICLRDVQGLLSCANDD